MKRDWEHGWIQWLMLQARIHVQVYRGYYIQLIVGAENDPCSNRAAVLPAMQNNIETPLFHNFLTFLLIFVNKYLSMLQHNLSLVIQTQFLG